MAGLNAMGFKANMHPFHYPEQLSLHPDIMGFNNGVMGQLPEGGELSKFVEKSKIIHFFASSFIDTGINLNEKPVVMQHGGRTYREGHEQLNSVYNKFCDATIIQMPDLLGHGANNEQFIYFPVDTDFIKPNFEKVMPEDKLVIGFFPSQPKDKGIDQVKSVINSLGHLRHKFEFVTLREHNGIVIWLDSLDRMRKCDLIIDVFSEKTVNGYEYGEWGNTSFEAAALGKVVLTMSMNFKKYKDEFGSCELNITNTGDQLRDTLIRYIEMSKKELREKKVNTCKWVTDKHSIRATAKRLVTVYKDILKKYS